MSESVALFVTVSVVSAGIVMVGGVVTNTGALFTSFTVTVKLFVAARPPLSTTRTTNRFVLGPCASVGVQEITPEPEMVAPVGAVNSEYVSGLAGISGSVALSVTV